MSRAFVKESETDAIVDDLPERQQSPHPNYVTPQGLAQLERERAVLLEKRRQLLQGSDEDIAQAETLRHVERDIRYLDGRIERAIYIDPANQPHGEVAFGATVTVIDEDGQRHSFQIVGEDEANASAGKVSWVSPLARALVGARTGGMVTWERPAGDKMLRVQSIRYGTSAPKVLSKALAKPAARPAAAKARPVAKKKTAKPAPKTKVPKAKTKPKPKKAASKQKAKAKPAKKAKRG
ncbi:MAG: GreA/GreB family elongation factor [Alphaproteobacteria bacterium]